MRRRPCDDEGKMRCAFRVWWICALLCSPSVWAAFPGIRFLDDIGDLGMPDNPHTYVQLGAARAFWADDKVQFEGHDDAGKMWRAILPISGGIGYTAVWQADFDNN